MIRTESSELDPNTKPIAPMSTEAPRSIIGAYIQFEEGSQAISSLEGRTHSRMGHRSSHGSFLTFPRSAADGLPVYVIRNAVDQDIEAEDLAAALRGGSTLDKTRCLFRDAYRDRARLHHCKLIEPSPSFRRSCFHVHSGKAMLEWLCVPNAQGEFQKRVNNLSQARPALVKTSRPPFDQFPNSSLLALSIRTRIRVVGGVRVRRLIGSPVSSSIL